MIFNPFAWLGSTREVHPDPNELEGVRRRLLEAEHEINKLDNIVSDYNGMMHRIATDIATQTAKYNSLKADKERYVNMRPEFEAHYKKVKAQYDIKRAEADEAKRKAARAAEKDKRLKKQADEAKHKDHRQLQADIEKALQDGTYTGIQKEGDK